MKKVFSNRNFYPRLDEVSKKSIEQDKPLSLLDTVKSMGFKGDSHETTPGAIKHWLTSQENIPIQQISEILNNAGFSNTIETDYGDDSLFIYGKGFRLEKQGKYNIFLARYRKGPAGKEYQMGIDV